MLPQMTSIQPSWVLTSAMGGGSYIEVNSGLRTRDQGFREQGVRSPDCLVLGLFSEESLQLLEVFENLLRAGQHPPGSLRSGHAEHEIDGLPEPIRERDLG